MSAALEVRGLCKAYPTASGELSVLRGIEFTMNRGGQAAVMGPSGSGKSTLLSIIGTLESPTSGTVRVEGVDPFGLPEPELARFRNRRIGFVFQDHHLLGHCTAMENVLLPTMAEGGSDATIVARARELLERVGLGARMDHLPSELSGGERQRVAVARALINGPSLVLADEPTGNLDRASAEIVGKLLIEMAREREAVLMVATHSAALAGEFSIRYEFEEGNLRRAS